MTEAEFYRWIDCVSGSEVDSLVRVPTLLDLYIQEEDEEEEKIKDLVDLIESQIN